MKEITYEDLNSMDLSGANVLILFKPRKKTCGVQLDVLKKMENENSEVGFYKVNIQKNAKIAFKYKAFGLPSILIFQDGSHEHTLSGYHDESQIRFYLKN